MTIVTGALEFIGGVVILGWRVLKLVFTARLSASLLLEQMVLLGVNSIPITTLVVCFAGSVYTFVLADELSQRNAENLVGGLLLLILLKELIPVFSALVLSAKIGAPITSEIGTMKISEQLDALRALSTDHDWYLTLPRVLAGVIMIPLVAVFAGYGGWFAGYITGHLQTGFSYHTFISGAKNMVGIDDFVECFVKCIVFAGVIVLTACYYGYKAEGGAAGVGKAVTRGVVINILLIFILDLLITAVLD
ncbi:MAG TPA: ABC transporter permease [Firmicutes bacterium]|nr:ABC transporter permease [Bacillota bacterium]